ncbi:MAG: hypothetical protein IKR38_03215 [Bacteroidales bacterium]|nr:hypothetical protein [Bacteroidales bacterium]
MKMSNAFFAAGTALLAAMCLVSCGKDPASDTPNNYGFKYPSNCWGGGAVWWEMHENRIYQEPGVSENIVDGDKHATYTATLDLYQCGYLGINDYFAQIMAAGYELQYGATADEWVNGTDKLINTQFFRGEDPYETWGTVSYHKNHQISLGGNRQNGSVSAKYDAPSLAITYTYFEQYY